MRTRPGEPLCAKGGPEVVKNVDKSDDSGHKSDKSGHKSEAGLKRNMAKSSRRRVPEEESQE